MCHRHLAWTGCYVGANIGAGWQKNRPLDPLLPIDLGNVTDTGVVGGGQIGCDYQFAGSGFVVGFQGMFDGAGINGNSFLPFAYAGDTTMSYAFKTDWFGTLYRAHRLCSGAASLAVRQRRWRLGAYQKYKC